MIDRSFIGTRLQTVTATAERGQMRLFAKATLQTDPTFLDQAAARGAGFRDVIAPPTFANCLYAMAREDSLELVRILDLDMRRILHAEQSFRHFAPICCGDTLTFTSEIADIFAKKAGALQFVVQRTEGHNQVMERVAIISSTIVVRAPEQHP